MAVNFGACDLFVRGLRRSNLIEAGQLDDVVNSYLSKNLQAKPPALAEHLVQQDLLTPFQAERLLNEDPQPLVVGPYVLLEALGFGSMGSVYKALNKADNQRYAIKVMPRRSIWNVMSVRRHIQTFKKVQHPAVVTLIDVGTAGGQHYLVWPLAEGEPLQKVIEREEQLLPGVAAHYGLQIAEAMEDCSRNDLFHGLLKPSNLLIDAQHRVHILDFGIGIILTQTSEDEQSMINTQGQANLMTGALDFSSPESISDPSNLNVQGDQYSLGCILYYGLTGRHPFEGDAVQKMVGHQTRQPIPVRELSPSVPAALAAVVERLMQKAPEDRYGSPAEIMDALKPLALDPLRFPQLVTKGPAAAAERRLPTRKSLSDLKKATAARVEEPPDEPNALPAPVPDRRRMTAPPAPPPVVQEVKKPVAVQPVAKKRPANLRLILMIIGVVVCVVILRLMGFPR